MITTSDFTRPEQDRRAGTRAPKTYRTILVALDGSLLAERALPFARRLAVGTGACLVLARAVTARTDRPDPDAEGEAEAYLKRIVRQERGHGRTHLAVLAGEPAPALLAYARSRAADLVVMATHGRSGLGRWLYGSVADAVLRGSELPVLLVPAGGGTGEAVAAGGRPGRVLVALDGSHAALAALAPARALAAALGWRLLLLRAVEPPSGALYRPPVRKELFHPEVALAGARRYLRGVAATLLPGTAGVDVLAVQGAAAPSILAAAQETGADLVVMATHGRGGLARAALGSVAAETLHRATVPLMLVRVPAAVTPDRHAGDTEAEPEPANEPGRGSEISPVTLRRSAMTTKTTKTTKTATRGGAVVTSGRTQRVDFDEGEFDAACDVCGVRPTAIVVRVWDEEFEALQKTGEAGLVEAHAFCAEHQGAADDLYHQLVRP